MRKLIITIAGLASAGAALAQVDTTRPMLTGHGNVVIRPQRVIVANQTATASGDTAVTLEKFVVTGSLIKAPAKAAKQK